MVEIVVSEHQLACLKAAVRKGSIEYAALEAAEYVASDEIAPGPIAVTFTCSLAIAQQLLAIARASCPDVATGFARRSTSRRIRPSEDDDRRARYR
jgi:hypothetical protein